jgi:hypothetical protein
MIRDTIARLGDCREWRLEVAEESGAVGHLFRITAASVGDIDDHHVQCDLTTIFGRTFTERPAGTGSFRFLSGGPDCSLWTPPGRMSRVADEPEL